MTTNENAVVTPNAGTPRLARPMVDDQLRARIFGVLFILTFATSIPAAMIFQPVVADPAAYLAGAGSVVLTRVVLAQASASSIRPAAASTRARVAAIGWTLGEKSPT